MRVENWSWKEADKMVEKGARERQLKAAEVLKESVKQHLASQLGHGKTYGVSRSIYKTGKYAGQEWTKRDPGELMRSIRVVEKEEIGYLLMSFGNFREVRVYAGHFLAWYAQIFEYSHPFMRPAIESSKAEMKDILENG